MDILRKEIKTYYVFAYPINLKKYSKGINYDKIKEIKAKLKEVERRSKITIKIPAYIWNNEESIREKFEGYNVLVIPEFFIESKEEMNEKTELIDLKTKKLEAELTNKTSFLIESQHQKDISLKEQVEGRSRITDEFDFKYVSITEKFQINFNQKELLIHPYLNKI